MLYYIWIDAERCITVDDGKKETAGDAISLHNGMIVPNDAEDENADEVEDAREGAASVTDSDVLIMQIQDMLARQHNAR